MTGREVVLEGAVNVRDLGGLRARDGSRVRDGLVLRSATLAELTAPDVSRLREEMGLRTVVDLRGEVEVTHDGRGLLADTPVAYENHPVVGMRSVRLDRADDLEGGDLAEHYIGYLETSAAVVVDVLRLLTRPGTVPAVVHCAAGKDRTGVVVAVLLTALGVDREAVVADYAATAAAMPQVRAQLAASAGVRELGPVPEWVLTAEPATMRTLLDHLDSSGGVEVWLRGHGFGAGELADLRAALLA